MDTLGEKYPKVRVTKQAYDHLAKLIPAIRAKRGLNVSRTDLVSEAILEIPLPSPTPGVAARKRKVRKSATAAVPAL